MLNKKITELEREIEVYSDEIRRLQKSLFDLKLSNKQDGRVYQTLDYSLDLKKARYYGLKKGFEILKELSLEIEKVIDELYGDDLAYGYKEYDRLGENMSTMEICHRENCNSFVIKKIKEELKQKLLGGKDDTQKDKRA
jgi:hypothetical protein